MKIIVEIETLFASAAHQLLNFSSVSCKDNVNSIIFVHRVPFHGRLTD